jgi:hypothetical protein
MADNLLPIPPSQAGMNVPDPMATPDPIAVINPDQTAQENENKAKQTFDAAVDSRDTQQLASVYKDNPTSSVGQAALDAVNHINKTGQQFKNIVDPVDQAGGPGTPAGNIAAAKQFETVKDHPQLGSALVAYLMGQKEAAFNLATGGQEKDSVEFGKDGGRFIRTTNALGQTVKVTDAQGNQLNPQQVDDLGLGYSSYESTQKAKLEVENKKARQAASQADTQAANAWGNQIDSHARLAAPLINGIQQLKTQIPLAKWQKIIGTVNQGTSVGTGGSTNNQTIGTKSLTTNSGAEAGASGAVNANVGSSENPIGGVGGKISANAATKSGVSATGTDQTIAGATSRQNREETLAKNKESMLAEAQAAGIKDPSQLALLIRTFDVMAQIKQEQGDLASTYKKPSFISLIGATKLGDQQSQLEAQLLQVLHNGEQMRAYRPFYNGSMDTFKKTNTTPDFGQIESEFINKSPEHENISNKYATFIGEALNRNAKDSLAAAEVAPATVAAPPPTTKTPPVSTNIPNKAVAPPRLSLDTIGKLYANQLRKS